MVYALGDFGVRQLAEVPGAVSDVNLTGGRVYLAVDEGGLPGLWTVDGRDAVSLTGVRGYYGTSIESVTRYGPKIVFMMFDEFAEPKWWQTDGTEEGTLKIEDAGPKFVDVTIEILEAEGDGAVNSLDVTATNAAPFTVKTPVSGTSGIAARRSPTRSRPSWPRARPA